MTVTAAAPAAWPTDAEGRVTPEPHFDDWDATPHAYFIVPVANVSLGDVVFGGTHQVEGMGRSEQRGTPALRFDLEYLAGSSVQASARVVLPVDHTIEVKRYESRPHAWAWIRVHPESDGRTYRPALVPDYRDDVDRCGCESGADADDLNRDGYEVASTMCDRCVESWSLDHDVVRHHR